MFYLWMSYALGFKPVFCLYTRTKITFYIRWSFSASDGFLFKAALYFFQPPFIRKLRKFDALRVIYNVRDFFGKKFLPIL